MTETRAISGPDEDSVWQQVQADLLAEPDPLQYHVVLEQGRRRTILDIDVDPGGGFEGGMAFTTFSTYLFSRNNFRFAVHTQNFIDEIGKFFGMQDVTLGYREFDERFVVKTNDEARVAVLFADPEIRTTLQALPPLSFGIVEYSLEQGDGKAPFLELKIEEGITEPARLRQICRIFSKVTDLTDQVA